VTEMAPPFLLEMSMFNFNMNTPAGPSSGIDGEWVVIN